MCASIGARQRTRRRGSRCASRQTRRAAGAARTMRRCAPAAPTRPGRRRSPRPAAEAVGGAKRVVSTWHAAPPGAGNLAAARIGRACCLAKPASAANRSCAVVSRKRSVSSRLHRPCGCAAALLLRDTPCPTGCAVASDVPPSRDRASSAPCCAAERPKAAAVAGAAHERVTPDMRRGQHDPLRSACAQPPRSTTLPASSSTLHATSVAVRPRPSRTVAGGRRAMLQSQELTHRAPPPRGARSCGRARAAAPLLAQRAWRATAFELLYRTGLGHRPAGPPRRHPSRSGTALHCRARSRSCCCACDAQRPRPAAPARARRLNGTFRPGTMAAADAASADASAAALARNLARDVASGAVTARREAVASLAACLVREMGPWASAAAAARAPAPQRHGSRRGIRTMRALALRCDLCGAWVASSQPAPAPCFAPPRRTLPPAAPAPAPRCAASLRWFGP